jgi:hypothetical protein
MPTHLRDLAARCARGLQEISAPGNQRAWGMPGARCTRSLVCAIGSKYAHEYSQRAIGNHPTFPHAMVYGLFRALPGDRLSCHRRYADRSAKLDASVGASGPHVFAVRRPTLSSQALSASTASRPAFVTLRNAPLLGRDSGDIEVIWVGGQAVFLKFRNEPKCRRRHNGFPPGLHITASAPSPLPPNPLSPSPA